MICLPTNFQYKKWTSARVRIMIPLICVTQRGSLHHYNIITHYYISITMGSIITHYHIIRSSKLADEIMHCDGPCDK